VGDGGGESKVLLPARSSLSLLVLGWSFFFFAEDLVKRLGRTIKLESIDASRTFFLLMVRCGAVRLRNNSLINQSYQTCCTHCFSFLWSLLLVVVNLVCNSDTTFKLIMVVTGIISLSIKARSLSFGFPAFSLGLT